jgi:proline racemase
VLGMVHRFRSIDAHVGGAPVRVIVEGVPRTSVRALEKRQSITRQAEPLRRAVMLEPRGHPDLCGAWLTEPISPGAHAGVLFVDGAGFPAFSGAAAVAVVTVALEHRLFDAPDVERLTLDTPIGTVHARVQLQVTGGRRRVESVALTSVPCFVAAPGITVPIRSRELRVDLAFGGLFHAIVDTEAIGVPLEASTLPELRRLAVRISEAVNATGVATHPGGRAASGVAGVVFTGPPRDPEAHLRNVTISSSGAVDRSASVTGTGAVMAVLDAMGLLQDAPFVHESLIGTLHRGRVVHRTQVGETPAIVPEIEATAWVTGEHTFYVDEDDPLKDGFSVADFT